MLSKEIAQQFRAAHLEGSWVALNLKSLISDITLAEANTRIGSINTIAALVYHINYYISGVNKVLKGGKLEIRDKYSFDLPKLHTEEEWGNLVTKLTVDAESFANSIESLDNESLHSPFVDPQYGNYYKNIHAMIQHVYYHTGQIAILKKLIRENY